MKIKFYTTVILIIIISFVIGFAVPRNNEMFKLGFHNEADLAFIGDSRTEVNIDPSSVKAHLHNGKNLVIRNCGLSGTALSVDFVKYAIDVLKHDSECKYIVLGLSASNLGVNTPDYPCYTDMSKRWRKWFCMHFDTLSVNDIRLFISKNRASGKGSKKYTYHEDGWLEVKVSNKNKVYSEDGAIPNANNDVDLNKRWEVGLSALSEMIAYARKQNMDLYVYEMPVFGRHLDWKRKGYWNSEFVKEKVLNMGGIWIEVEDDTYYSYDKSHMESESAKLFSAHLGEALDKAIGLQKQ